MAGAGLWGLARPFLFLTWSQGFNTWSLHGARCGLAWAVGLFTWQHSNLTHVYKLADRVKQPCHFRLLLLLTSRKLYWVEQSPQKTHRQPEPHNVTLFGNSVFADVIS